MLWAGHIGYESKSRSCLLPANILGLAPSMFWVFMHCAVWLAKMYSTIIMNKMVNLPTGQKQACCWQPRHARATASLPSKDIFCRSTRCRPTMLLSGAGRARQTTTLSGCALAVKDLSVTSWNHQLLAAIHHAVLSALTAQHNSI